MNESLNYNYPTGTKSSFMNGIDVAFGQQVLLEKLCKFYRMTPQVDE